MDDNGLIGLTEELKNELNATKYTVSNSNKIQLIAKADIKVNIGRSPDIADALALTYCGAIIERRVIDRKREYQTKFME
jgi:Holliday junction resolvasome RuvABC endonuclease subunit